MSIVGKTWKLSYERPVGEALWTSLLKARKIEDPGQFFANASVGDLHDPFLFPDMQKAVDRVQKAIKARERIVVYGDYDVDGTSGAALLIHTLRFLGAEVSYRIPHRQKDGYGLHNKYVEELLEQQVKVLITVDCGISCAKEVALAQANGMDVLLTDHHTLPKELPEAHATLHPQLAPKYPFKDLSGSGVAFKLACALLIATDNEDFIPRLTDLASLGTVADCVHLTGENRALLKLGLQQMGRTEWDGLRSILESAGAWRQAHTSETIGFQVGPRINASGRMSHPYWALQTLIAEGEEARQKSLKLEELNRARQELTRSITEEASAAVDPSQALLIAKAEHWPSSVAGLIAGRLQERFSKPTFILEDRGDSLVGSGRSLPGFHLVEALNTVSHLLEAYGGHEQAAGFHLKKENYEAFKEGLLKHAAAQPNLEAAWPVDLALQPEELTVEHCEKINSFAPFGIGNPKPLFLLEDVQVLKTRPVGRDAMHLKFTVDFGGQQIDGIAFGMAEHELDFHKATKLLAHLELNVWQERQSPQLQLVDFAA